MEAADNAMPLHNGSASTRLATALGWLRDCLLALDLIVVVSVFIRLCLSGSVGLAEWVYHMNRIDSMDQAPQAMGNFVAFLAALLAATVCAVVAAGMDRPPRGANRGFVTGLFSRAAAR